MEKKAKRNSRRTDIASRNPNFYSSLENHVNVGADRTIVRLKWGDIITVSIPAGGYIENLFNLNSAFDPDRTGGATQPTGYDQWAAIYRNYRVLRTKVEVQTMPYNAAGLSGVLLMGPSTSGALDTTLQDRIGEPRTKAVVYGGAMAAPPKALSAVYYMPELFGVTPEQYGSSVYSADYAASPAEAVVQHVGLASASKGVDASCPRLFVTMEFEMEWYARVELEVSREMIRVRDCFNGKDELSYAKLSSKGLSIGK